MGWRGRGRMGMWPGRGPFSYLPPWQRPGWIYGRGACWYLYRYPGTLYNPLGAPYYGYPQYYPQQYPQYYPWNNYPTATPWSNYRYTWPRAWW